MNKILVSAALGASMLLPSAALAVENLNSFSLAGQTFDPAAMSCSEFMAASPGLKMFVSSWYDGDATMDSMYELQYSRTDVLDMQANLIKGCGETPNETLINLYFDYGGTEPDYENATCQVLNGINNVADAANLIGWVTGYFAYSLENTAIVGADFVTMGNSVVQSCAAAPEDQIAKYVWAGLGLGSADEFEGYYDWDDDYDYDYGNGYEHTPIDFSIPSYYYDKNIMN